MVASAVQVLAVTAAAVVGGIGVNSISHLTVAGINVLLLAVEIGLTASGLD